MSRITRRGSLAAVSSAGPSNIVISHLTSGVDSNYDTPAVTSAISPNSGSAVLVSVGVSRASDLPPDNFIVSGLGLTWVQVASVTYASRRRTALWVGTGTVSAGSITITSYGSQEIGWIVEQVEGLDHSAPILGTPGSFGQNSGGGAVTASATGSPAVGDATYSMCQVEIDAVDVTPEVGWATLGSTQLGGSHLGVRRMESAWYAGAGDDGCTWSKSGSSGASTITTYLKSAP